MSFINFPNVPNVPGVPAILRSITVPTPGALLNMAMGAAAEAVFGKVVWGIFETTPGTPAVAPSSTIELQKQLDEVLAASSAEVASSLTPLQNDVKSLLSQSSAAKAAGDSDGADALLQQAKTENSQAQTILDGLTAKYRGKIDDLRAQIAAAGGKPAVPGTVKEALTPDSFVGIDYKNNMRVSNYPQEEGAFASYNKVGTPYDCRVRMAIGGDKATRTAFLAKCDAMLKSIDLYTVITPEAQYTNASLENYDYRRESRNGATLLIVDLAFIEVRITAVATFSAVVKPGQPSGADPVSGGQVQAPAVPSGLQGAIGAVSGTVAAAKAAAGNVAGAISGAISGAAGSATGAVSGFVGGAVNNVKKLIL